MALNFPANPNDNDTWVDPANGALYRYAEATNSWSVVGISVGGGTVNSVSINGTGGISVTGGPIVDVGSITVGINVDSLTNLPV